MTSGTTPLTGERAQAIFRGRPRGRLGTVGSGNGCLRGRPRGRLGTVGSAPVARLRSSSSFWVDPRCRSHLKTEQFRNTPDVIGQSCGHGWGAWRAEMLSVTQLLMGPTEIGGTADHIHARLKGPETLGGMPTFARQRRQTFPHGLGKDTARRVLFRAYVSASSPPNPACKLSLHQALHHPSPAQLPSGISLCFDGCVLLYVL